MYFLFVSLSIIILHYNVRYSSTLNSMEPSEFLVQCQVLLDDEKTTDVLKLVQDENNREFLADVGWELVSVLCKQLTKYENEEKLNNIEESLLELLQRCSAKEVMLGLSEHLATEFSVKSFIVTMRLCKVTIIQLKRRQSKYLLNVCKHFISKMRYLLEQSTQKEDEQNEYSKVDIIETVYDLISSSIDFINGMVSHIGRVKSVVLQSFLCESFNGKSWQCYEISCCRETVVNFIFDILEVCVKSKIFVMPSLLKHKETISILILSAFTFISFPDLLDYLKLNGQNVCRRIGIVIFFYLLLVQCSANHEIPLVYKPEFLFDLLHPHINSALKSSQYCITKISLDLLSDFLLKLNSECFSMCFLSSLQEISISLTKMMIWCQEENLRKHSQSVFLSLLETMKVDTRYFLLYSIYEQSGHPGLHGYLITQINKTIENVFLYDEGMSNKLHIGDLAMLFTQIVIGENNVLHESDRFIASLNFVRFWLLREKRLKNQTGIWSRLTELNRNISIMATCIDISKSELEEQLNHLSHPNRSTNVGFHTEILLSLPGGETFPELSTNEKTGIVSKALLTLDIMSSIIARIHEISCQKDCIDT